jgi:hypothetical protein
VVSHPWSGSAKSSETEERETLPPRRRSSSARIAFAITATKTTTLFGFRSWFRGRQALRKDIGDYRLAVSDEDYLQLQRNTVQMLEREIADMIQAAEHYRDDPSSRRS